MRFIPNGPSLPDELLTARDAGDVLFFCGAGVSRAEAHLPDFATLAEKVLDLLGSALDSPARRLFDAGRRFEKASGLTGLVATDRIFGMLEREFEPTDVREAVAIALKPEPGCGLAAHRTLLDLSRTRAGVARLVTTNFDLLFEECEPGIISSNPPRLPDPRRDIDFRGIIHLHGRVDTDYRRACDDEFVLSSADFGHAYLSDGWATRYIQALLRRFRIVFVGYSADDPPVQYLLEALNRFEKPGHKLYAFQSGNATAAMAQWAHKGVEPIAYDSANGHAALWKTLSAWAARACDVDGWHDRLIMSASKGPVLMPPHERGMIAHLASTITGARLLAAAHGPLPAEWLSVFDRNARYAQADKVDSYDQTSDRFDPFEAFGLDSDMPPTPIDPDQFFTKRAVPENAWDGVASLSSDRTDLSPEEVAQLRGVRADVAISLPPRLWHLGIWIVRVAHQPAALWWAAKQARFHPSIQQRIEWSLRHDASLYPPAVRDGWRILLACWQQKVFDPDQCRYDIEARAEREGWSTSLVREAVALYQPMLTVKSRFGAMAPEANPALELKAIIQADVEYPRPHQTLDIPPDLLGYAVALFREKLGYAVQLEREVNGHDDLYFDTTRPDDGDALDEDSYGLTGHLAIFTKMVARLTVEDRTAARKEAAQWSGINDPLFTRLRIWAAGRNDLTTPEEAGQIFLDLNDDTFWTSKHERDLLFSLRDRWSEMPSSTIAEIESRLRDGEVSWATQHENSDELIAHYRLNRLHWLSTQGVTFSFNFDAEVLALRALASEWTERASANTAQPNVSKIRGIDIDTSATPLEQLPISEVLEKAKALGHYDFDSHIQRQPFRGFAEKRPVRALSVLTDAARKSTFEPWAWSALLSSVSKVTTSPRMLSTIGQRLARLPADNLAEIVHPVSAWLSDQHGRLLVDFPVIFDLVWEAMVAALVAAPSVKRYPRPDRAWVDESLNSPVGRMVDALLKDPAKTKFEPCSGMPEAWKHRLDRLLELPGDHRPHAIAMITPQLNWLFHIDPNWVHDQLLPLASGRGNDSSAFWAGYFWRAHTPQHSLYLLLKPGFIALASQSGQRRDEARILAGMLLAGWGGTEDAINAERLISDIELRNILIHAEDDMRVQMLWHLEHWTLESGSRWGDLLVPFLTRVWPRQRDVRTALISGRLAELALALPDRFPEIVEIILPRLVPIKGASLRFGPIIDPDSSIARRHPQALLKLLGAILAEDPVDWPYGAEKLLTQLAAQPETRVEPRLVELLREQR